MATSLMITVPPVTVPVSTVTLTAPNWKAVGVWKPAGLPTLKPRSAPWPEARSSSTFSSFTCVWVISLPYFSTAAWMAESRLDNA